MANWFFYDWYTDKEPARFTVDLGLSGREGNPVAFLVECAAAAPAGLTGRALRHVDRLEGKCLKLGLILAGRVITDTQKQLYFYGPSMDALSALEELASKEKLLKIRADAREDPDWTLYEGYLYPDAAKFETEKNRELIDKLSRAGDNAAAVRRVRLHMFFPAEPLMQMFAQQAKQAGFALGDTEFQPEMERAHGIVVVRLSTLEKRAVDNLTSEAIYLAKPYDGMLSFWDCPLVPKRSPLR